MSILVMFGGSLREYPGDACGERLGDGKSRFPDLSVDRAGPRIIDDLAMSWPRLGVSILVMFWGSLGGRPGDACGEHLGDGKSRFLDLLVDWARPTITDGLAMHWGEAGGPILVMLWGSLGGYPGNACGEHLGDGKSRFPDFLVD